MPDRFYESVADNMSPFVSPDGFEVLCIEKAPTYYLYDDDTNSDVILDSTDEEEGVTSEKKF